MRAVHEKGGLLRFQAKGFSMAPFIRDGDILTVSPLSKKIEIGEVVPYVKPGFDKLIVHRVVGKKGQSFSIKGDNCFYFDGKIPQENLLGWVSRVERGDKDIRFGLGSEKKLIALLSSSKILNFLLFFVRTILVLFRGKRSKNA